MTNFLLKITIATAILIVVSCLYIHAQETIKKPKVLDELLQTDSKDRLIFEVAHANWSNRPADTKLKWHSRAINIYLMYDIALNKKGNVSFAPGVGIGTNVYSHNKEFGVNDEGKTSFNTLGETVNYDTNILSTNFFDIPLELRFRTNPDKLGKRFKIALGFKGGYLFNGHTKWAGELKRICDPTRICDPETVNASTTDLTTGKFKNFSIPNLNNLRYGYTLRIGYSNFNIVGFYSAAPLFEIGKNSTVENGVKPFYIGFSFNSL